MKCEHQPNILTHFASYLLRDCKHLSLISEVRFMVVYGGGLARGLTVVGRLRIEHINRSPSVEQSGNWSGSESL